MRSDFINTSKSSSNFNSDAGSGWVILSPVEAGIKKKIEAAGIPLKDWDISIYRGILTGFNEAFIINSKTKDELIKASPNSAEIIRPILRGKHIKKYKANNSESIIFIPCGWTNANRGKTEAEIFIAESFPEVYRHLLLKSKVKTKGKGLFKREDQGDYWWELRPCAYVQEFNKEKIIYIDIMTDNEEEGYLFPCFSYSLNGELILNTAYFMVGKPNELLYILAVLNSKIGKFIVRNYVTQLQQRQFRLFQQNVETFPIAKTTSQVMDVICEKIKLIIQNKELLIDIKQHEKELDDLLFGIYNLTTEEKEVIGFIEIQ